MTERAGVLRLVGLLACAAVVACALLWLDAPLWVRSLAAFLLAVVVPGVLLTQALLGSGESPPTALEWAVYSVAMGLAALTVLLMALSYLPGPLALWQVQGGFALLVLALAGVVIWQGRGARTGVEPAPFADARLSVRQRRWLLVGLVALGLLAGLFRFVNLGDSEFHGDEARAVLRAAAVIQGYENVLFIHRKPPGEILLPTAVFAFAGRIDEAAARLPFALANLVALLGVLLLGWRLRGAAAGWAAAFLLALDGYLVAFARFVQYQSIVLLMSVAAVLVFHRIYREPRALNRYMAAGALFLATALLYHWDGLLAFLPAGLLLGFALAERRVTWSRMWRAAIPAATISAAVLALFFAPYFLQPGHEAATSYLVEARLAGQTPGLRNNIADIVARTTVYSSIYYVAILALLAATALVAAWRRGWGRPAAIVAGAVVALTLAGALPGGGRIAVGGVDLTGLSFLVLIAGVWFAPRLPNDERTLWIWFGAPLIASLFLIATPRTHVHIFFVPWALVAGLAVDMAWRWLAGRTHPRAATGAALAAAAVAAIVVGGWLYLAFVDSARAMVLNWPETKPDIYWAPKAADTIDGKYAFPVVNGWKQAGSLYAAGAMRGDYDVVLWENNAPMWYLRDQWRCLSSADWYFTVRALDPWAEPPEAVYDRIEAEGFAPWADAQVFGRPAMRMFARAGVAPSPPPNLASAGYEEAFDAAADPYLRLDFPAVEPAPSNRLNANFGNKITLEGYDLDVGAPLRAGDVITLTLHWRSAVRIGESYKVSNQIYDERGNFAAQKDAIPVCDRRDTSRWRPGEAVIDRHTIQINEDAPAGVYPLFTMLYRADTGERLPRLDATGQPVDDKVEVARIEIAGR